MAFQIANCPNCNGELQISEEVNFIKCMYCAEDIVIEEMIGEHASMVDIRGGAREEYDTTDFIVANTKANREKKFYTDEYSLRTARILWWFWVIGLCGLHRCYLRFHATGGIWFLTVGFGFWGQWIDYFRLEDLVEEANSRTWDYNFVGSKIFDW